MHEHEMKREALPGEAAAVEVDREVVAYTEGWIRGFTVARMLAPASTCLERVRGDDAGVNGDLLRRP